MGSECLSGMSGRIEHEQQAAEKLSATPAPDREPEPEPIRMRGPEGLVIEVAGNSTVGDLLAATQRAGCRARRLTFCDERLAIESRLVDLGIYDDAEFGIVPCAHWRLRVVCRDPLAQSCLGTLRCPDCDAITSTNPIAYHLVDSFRTQTSLFARNARGTYLIFPEGAAATDLLGAWRAARGPEAMAACAHPIMWCPRPSSVECCKCGWAGRLIEMINRPPELGGVSRPASPVTYFMG